MTPHEEGQLAHLAGRKARENPYKQSTEDGRMWRDGWQQAAKEAAIRAGLEEEAEGKPCSIAEATSPSLETELALRLKLAHSMADRRKLHKLLTEECRRLQGVVRERQHRFEHQLAEYERAADSAFDKGCVFGSAITFVLIALTAIGAYAVYLGV